MRFGPSSAGRALCLECRVSWVRIPPEVALPVLLCFVVCMALLCFFLPVHCIHVYTCRKIYHLFAYSLFREAHKATQLLRAWPPSIRSVHNPHSREHL